MAPEEYLVNVWYNLADEQEGTKNPLRVLTYCRKPEMLILENLWHLNDFMTVFPRVSSYMPAVCLCVTEIQHLGAYIIDENLGYW